MKFCFGDIVIVDGDQIGVVVKSWGKSLTGSKRPVHHEVYVRNYRGIREYEEDQMERYMVRHKELNEEEIGYQQESIDA